MKKTLSLLSWFLWTVVAMGQTLESDMVNALNLHESAKTATAQLKGLEAMEETIKKYPKEWLPNFWACYQSTQMAMLKNRSKDYPAHLNEHELLDRSERYLEKAMALAGNEMTDPIRGDFHSLKSLIMTFRQTYSADEEEAKKYAALKVEELRKAAAMAPENPVMMVFAATDLGRKEEADYAELVASVQLMKQAQKTFETYPVKAITTHFNQEWIQYWLPWIEGKLTKLGTEEGEVTKENKGG